MVKIKMGGVIIMILIIFFVKSMQLTRNELWLMMVNCDVTTMISMFYNFGNGTSSYHVLDTIAYFG